MEFPYETDTEGVLRPLVAARFHLNGLSIPPAPATYPCLVDTGSARTFLAWEIGTEHRVWADTTPYGKLIPIGGDERRARQTTVTVEIPDPNGGESILIPHVPIFFVQGKLPVPGLLGASALNGLVAVFRDREGLLNLRKAEDFASDGCPHYNGKHPL